MKMVTTKKVTLSASHRKMRDQMEKVKPAGVMNSSYLSLMSPTVERNTEPTPAPDPASALKTAMRVKVRTVDTISPTLSGEWGGGGRSPILVPGTCLV